MGEPARCKQSCPPLLWVSAAAVCPDDRDGHRSAFPPGGKFHPRILLHWIRFKCVFTSWETAASSTALALKLQNQRWHRVTAPHPTRRGRPSLYLILNYATRHTYCHCDRAPCLWPGGRLFAASCLMRSCSDTKRVEKYRCHSSPHNILYNDPWWCLRLGYSEWQTGFPTFGNDISLLDVRETKPNKSPYVSGSSCDTET